MCIQVYKSYEHLGLASEQIQRTKVIGYGVRDVYIEVIFSAKCVLMEKRKLKEETAVSGIEQREGVW